MISKLAIAAGLLLAAPAHADTAWVTNQSSNDVSVVDLDLRKVVAMIEVGGKPAGVAAAPDGNHVYIVSPDSKTISEIDTKTRMVSRRLKLEEGGPIGVAVSPDSAWIYVTDWYGARVFVIDFERFQLHGQRSAGASPSGIAITPDGNLLVTADRDDNQISVINTKTWRTQHISVGERPFGVTIDTAGKRAYTADVGSNTVTIVDLLARKVIGSVKTGDRPYAVALAAGKGFATDQYGETITVFDLATLDVLDTVDSGEYPEGIATTSDGKHVVFANWFSNSLWIMDAETLEVVSEIEVGDGPRAFGQFLTKD